MEARIVLYPLVALAAVMMYQSTNPALYYMIGVGIYFWAYTDGEVGLTSPMKLELRLTFSGHLREELDPPEKSEWTHIVQSLNRISRITIVLSYCIARRWIPWIFI